MKNEKAQFSNFDSKNIFCTDDCWTKSACTVKYAWSYCTMPYFGFGNSAIYFEIKIVHFEPSHGIQMIE